MPANQIFIFHFLAQISLKPFNGEAITSTHAFDSMLLPQLIDTHIPSRRQTLVDST